LGMIKTFKLKLVNVCILAYNEEGVG